MLRSCPSVPRGRRGTPFLISAFFTGALALANDPSAASTCGDWSQLIPGDASPSPPARELHTMVYDAARARMVVFGGEGPSGPLNDVWVAGLSGTPAWSQLSPAGTPPPVHSGHIAIFDPPRDRMLVFGGYFGSSDLWELGFSGTPTWSLLSASGTPPSMRPNAGAVYDPVRQRLWMFGGDYYDDLYYIDLTTSPAWVHVSPTGGPPEARGNHVMVYDTPRDRILVYGGGPDGPEAFDLWELSLSGTPAWTPITPAGTPPDFVQPSGVYDPVGDRLVVVSSVEPGALVLSLSGTPTWSPLVTDAPPPQGSIVVAYDPANQRMLSYGAPGFENSLWALDLFEGNLLHTSALPSNGGSVLRDPDAPCYADESEVELTAVPASGYDFVGWSGDVTGTTNPVTITLSGERTVVANFEVSTATFVTRFDASEVESGIELRWSFGDPDRVAAVDVERREAGTDAWRAIALARRGEGDTEIGVDATVEPGRAYDYRLWIRLRDGETVLAGPISATGRPTVTRIERVAPNPATSGTTIAFAVARSGPVRLSIVDAQGREVARLVEGARTAGRYVVAWDGVARDRRLPAGVYFARLATPERSVVSKLVLAR